MPIHTVKKISPSRESHDLPGFISEITDAFSHLKDEDNLRKTCRKWIRQIVPYRGIVLYSFARSEMRHDVFDAYPIRFQGLAANQLEEGIVSWAQLQHEVFCTETETNAYANGHSNSIFVPLHLNGNACGVIQILPKNVCRLDDSTTNVKLSMLAFVLSAQIDSLKLRRVLQQKEHLLETITCQFQEMKKMASLGQLAGSVAHDINNPMTTILGRLQLVLELDALPASIRKNLELVERQAGRISELNHVLLSFAWGREKEGFEDQVQCNEIIANSLELVRHDLEIRQVEIKTLLEDNLPGVLGDKVQLQQVMINMIDNALDAVGPAGRVTLTSALKEDKIQLSVEDTGCGMRQEDIPNIFDPLFSTKRESGGTGLGLSICRQIVQKHQGDISVMSVLGQGTRFDITLPVALQ